MHRRHHNNKGVRQIRNGSTRKQVRQLAKKLGVPYRSDLPVSREDLGPDALEAEARRDRAREDFLAAAGQATDASREEEKEAAWQRTREAVEVTW